MRLVTRALVAALALPALAGAPTLAQSEPGLDQSIARGPMTAWCEPGQTLLSGGYELQGAEPPAPDAMPEAGSTAPPTVFVATSKPTVASSTAQALPMPRLAPVMNATLRLMPRSPCCIPASSEI